MISVFLLTMVVGVPGERPVLTARAVYTRVLPRVRLIGRLKRFEGKQGYLYLLSSYQVPVVRIVVSGLLRPFRPV